MLLCLKISFYHSYVTASSHHQSGQAMPTKNVQATFLLDACLLLLPGKQLVESFSIPPEPNVGIEQVITSIYLHGRSEVQIALHYIPTVVGEAYHHLSVSLAFSDP
jgi:hypothetical protein